MLRIGVFGGSFNPVHIGHTGLAKAAVQQFGLDKLLLIPCRMPPHKVAPQLAPANHRLEMCRIAAKGEEKFEVSDLEFHLPEPSYTYDTVLKLRQDYPNSEIYLIIGADMLLTFEKWHKWQELGSMVTLLAGARLYGQRDQLLKKAQELKAQGLRAEVFNLGILEVSSTEIRQRIREGADPSAFLEKGVMEYIKARGLYKTPEEKS